MGIVEDVQSYLMAKGIVDGSGDDEFRSVRRMWYDDFDRLVVISEDGGLPPEMPSSEGIGDVAWQEGGVHVEVRAEAGNSDASLAKAKEIKDALHGLVGAVLGSNYYHAVRASMTEPVGVFVDGRPIHTLSYRLTYDVTTPT